MMATKNTSCVLSNTMTCMQNVAGTCKNLSEGFFWVAIPTVEKTFSLKNNYIL